MELSLREAAALLGRKERTLRAQLSRGEVRGVKRDGKWVLVRAELPASEAQRARVQARADAIRRAVDEALPSRAASRASYRRRSIVDVDCFRAACEVWRELSGREDSAPRPSSHVDAAAEMRRGLLELSHGVAAFDPVTKVDALRAARRCFSYALACLWIGPIGVDPEQHLAVRLESEVLPALGGLLRWSERLRERRA